MTAALLLAYNAMKAANDKGDANRDSAEWATAFTRLMDALGREAREGE
jgi:hypothetical protein